MNRPFAFTLALAAAVALAAIAIPHVDIPALALVHGTAHSASPLDGLAESVGGFALAGLIVNRANLNDLFRGFQAAFNTGFRGITPYWSQIATLVPSTTKEEKYAWLGQFPKLREWIGDRHLKSLASHTYSILNKDFESTVEVPKNDIVDDTYGVYTPLMQEMGFSAAVHPDELVFGLLQAGFTTDAYDGQYFFDTDHPVGDGTVSNMQAGAGAPWFLMDTRRPLRPLIFQRRQDYMFQAMTSSEDEAVFMRKSFRYGVDARVNVGFGFWQQAFASKADLDDTNFNAALAAMMAFKSEEDRPLGIKPNLLVCGPTRRAAALDVVKAERRANGATNTNRDAVDVLVVEWLV